ncbi:MAG: hypothetical protein C0604_04400 [Clostridiales bacterium]|nr:MAG: hypothetical protein C0604_04400 [Clostridiales bacterium]
MKTVNFKMGSVVMVGLILSIALSGCANKESAAKEIEAEAEKPIETGFEELTEPEEEAAGQILSDADLKSLGVNEMGKIMIVMYHSISDEEKNYVRSR